MDDGTIEHARPGGYDDEGDDPAPSGRARLALPAGWLAPFGIGIVLGWIVLGWWLWPVTWTDALPADLTPADRATYVRLVADAYVRRPDVATAAERLASFPAPTLAAVLDAQAARTDDLEAAENARQLARALATARVVAPATPAAAAVVGEVVASTAPAAVSRRDQPAFWLILFGLAALAALAVAGLRRAGGDAGRARALARRRARLDARGRGAGDDAILDAARDAAGASRLDPAAPADAGSAPGDIAPTDDARWAEPRGGAAAGEPPRAPGATRALEVPRRAPQRTGRLGLPELPPDDSAALPLPRAPWQRAGEAGLGPGKLDFGATAAVLYDGSDEHFYQTWLVFDDRQGLSASINIRARRVGSLATLDVWLYDRDVTDEAASPIKVAVLSQAASQEAHVRALLRDRQLLPAVPGAHTVLEVGELSLEVTVSDVAPPPEAGSLKLDRVRLALTPYRYPQHPPADDLAAQPRPPLPFRRDDGR